MRLEGEETFGPAAVMQAERARPLRRGRRQYSAARLSARKGRPHRHQNRLRRRRMRRLHGTWSMTGRRSPASRSRQPSRANASTPSSRSAMTGSSRRCSAASTRSSARNAAIARQASSWPPPALLRRNPDPSDEEILEALGSNICRCTGYVKIIEAVKFAVGARQNSGRCRAMNKRGVPRMPAA